MITLSKILNLKNEIESLAKAFGFKPHVRLVREDQPVRILQLLVEQEPNLNLSYKAIEYFKAKLIDLMGCKVNVTKVEGINELYRKFYLDNSAFLDEQALKLLFMTNNLEEVSFEEREQADRLFAIVLKQADDFLLEKTAYYSNNSILPAVASNSSGLFKPHYASDEVKIDLHEGKLILTIPVSENFKAIYDENSASIKNFANNCKKEIEQMTGQIDKITLRTTRSP